MSSVTAERGNGKTAEEVKVCTKALVLDDLSFAASLTVRQNDEETCQTILQYVGHTYQQNPTAFADRVIFFYVSLWRTCTEMQGGFAGYGDIPKS